MNSRDGIRLEATATEESFEEGGYLSANPDVRRAVEAGIFTSGLQHFQTHGYREDRKVKIAASGVADARRNKLQRVSSLLRHDMPHRTIDGRLDYLTDELRAVTKIVDTENESSNGYDHEILALVEKYSDGLILDCGAGRRQVYFPNVVNLEIKLYDSTDILGVGESLPFKDDSFDCIFSIAVLEHVRDPFLCASEICRVLKPGGELFCTVPFLQPLHGYPHHYFNATKQGIRRLFEDHLRIDDVYVSETGHPAYALHWFLENWTLGLDEKGLAEFRGMSVGDLVDIDPAMLKRRASGDLQLSRVDELASGFVLRGVRDAGPKP